MRLGATRILQVSWVAVVAFLAQDSFLETSIPDTCQQRTCPDLQNSKDFQGLSLSKDDLLQCHGNHGSSSSTSGGAH